MTPRERFNAVLDFKEPDRLPWLEWFDEEVLTEWGKQGWPILETAVFGWGMGAVIASWPWFKGFDPYTYFGCQNFWGCIVPVDVGPIPSFPIKVVREDPNFRDIMVDNGAVVREKKESQYHRYRMPMYLEFPVKDRKTWEEYKKRLHPEDIRRYPKNWNKDIYTEIFEQYQNGMTNLPLCGFYGFGAQLMGITRFNLAFYEDAELVHDMASYWEFYMIETLRDAVETLKDNIDLVYWWEDMAENHGPFISPKLYKDFFLPHYRHVIEFLKKNKIRHFMVDCDGNINPLLDLMTEAGLNGLWPLEARAGMDAISLRHKYPTLFVGGNLDKRKIAEGGKKMQEEVDSKLPELKELGGYFVSMDHLVSPEITHKKFIEYKDYIQKHL